MEEAVMEIADNNDYYEMPIESNVVVKTKRA